MPISPDVVRSWVWFDPTGATQVHASTLTARVSGQPGRLLAAWFSGSREGAPDTGIMLARHDDGEDGWQPPSVLARTGDEAHWNPVLALGPDQRMWLFFKRGNTIGGWRTWVRTSADGVAWDDEAELGGRAGAGPVKNQPLLLADGSWLAPSSVEIRTGPGHDRWDALVDVSADNGATWSAHPIPLDHADTSGAGIIQPALLPPAGTSPTRGDPVVALCRSSAGRVYRATSADGRRWSMAEPTELPNNNSGLDAVRLPTGRIVCAHNPSEHNWGPRCPLVLSASDDGGRRWRQVCEIEDGDTPMPGPVRPDEAQGVAGSGEYSYPTIVLDGDRLLVSYTWQRIGIALAEIPVAAVAD